MILQLKQKGDILVRTHLYLTSAPIVFTQDVESEPLTWHLIDVSRYMTSSSSLSNSWNCSSSYSKRFPKVREQIILETALFILKWGLKGCPGSGRRDGNLSLFLFSIFYWESALHDIRHTEYRAACEALATAPTQGLTQRVLGQYLGSQTDDPGLSQ